MHLRALVAAGLLGSLVATPGMAEKWDMPTPYGPKTFHTVNIMQFAEEVKAATAGKLEITIHPNGSLFEHPDIKNAVRGGQVQMGEILMSLLENENPAFGLDAVPFLATNYDDAKKLWAASRKQVEALFDKDGVMVLYVVPWPPQGLYTKKEISTANDLKGLKFRAQNKAGEQLAQNLGMVPTQVEVPDIPQAFSTGRVEAMMTSPTTGVDSKAWDYLTHFYHTQAWLPKNGILVNKRAFQRLDKDIQKAVLDLGAKAEERGWKMSMDETATKLAELKAGGLKVADPSADLKASLKKVGDAMTEAWLAKAGAEGKAIIDAYRK
jgi:TRAP-type C4-dicarboxylate transport system substrate-binding protein